MEDFYMNITSQIESYNHITSKYNHITSPSINNDFICFVVTCLIIGMSLCLTLVAIYALDSQVRNDHVAPIYVINLLISNLIQLCCLIAWVAPVTSDTMNDIINFSYIYSLMVSVCFMVCIALERYLVVAHPLWYRCRRTIKTSVVVCVLVWVLAFVFHLPLYFWVHFETRFIILGVFFFLPLPLFMFSLGGTLKALSASSVPSDEKQRIVGILVVVLLIYALLILPSSIWYLSDANRQNFTFTVLSDIFLKLSPLADLTLYVFMRKGIIDKFLSSVCCCRMDSDDTNSPSV